MSGTADAPDTTLDPDPGLEPTRRERIARVLERRLDLPMAVLALVWTLLIAIELVAPGLLPPELAITGNAIRVVFVVELVAKLVVSARPTRFLRRHWPVVLFVVLPTVRVLRLVRTLRGVRLLPAARVRRVSYRSRGSSSGLLTGRLQFLLAMTAVVAIGGGQLLFVLEGGRDGAPDSLAEALWWAANLSMTTSMIYEPVTFTGRVLALAMAGWALIVFASLAATLGAFFLESRRERAATELGLGDGVDVEEGDETEPGTRRSDDD